MKETQVITASVTENLPVLMSATKSQIQKVQKTTRMYIRTKYKQAYHSQTTENQSERKKLKDARG